jgi:uncharacterized protein (TIGR03492 family)
MTHYLFLMKLLCLSNGHGEDAIALRILQALQQQPDPPHVSALPIVGEGRAYTSQGIPLVGAVKAMPSGGFIYMDRRQFARDLQGGLLQLTRSQLKTVKDWAKQGGMILAVGDIVPLLFAWWSGAPYAFVGTAQSEYYLRDEQGILPRRFWFDQLKSALGSVYSPWERWLMQHPRCKAVFPRDTLTAEVLKRWHIPAFDLGNPMMDGLEPQGISLANDPDDDRLTFILLPGSRVPEAYDNWQILIDCVAAVQREFAPQSLLFLAAIAPNLDLTLFQQTLESQGWQFLSDSPAPTLTQGTATLVLTSAFSDCLHQADLAIALSGTATEQFVGLGKPAITLPGKGPQFTRAFAEAQTRLLGISVILVASPASVAQEAKLLLQDAARLQQIRQNGDRRMGQAGAAQRIAQCLNQRMS